MKGPDTCGSCKENGCYIREKCPDDETSIEPREQILEEIPIPPEVIEYFQGGTSD